MPVDVRRLIRDISIANPLWGAPRIHGELLKLGIEVGQTTVAKYMVWGRRHPSQGWKTFLRNHADGTASMDLFVVPTISFRLLYGFLILHHGRREILWIGTTSHPSAEWIARQLTEAFGWEQAPRYIIRDRDRAYRDIVVRRIRAMGIRDRPTALYRATIKVRQRIASSVDAPRRGCRCLARMFPVISSECSQKIRLVDPLGRRSLK